MERFDDPGLRTIRRLNRRVHDPISAWLGAVFAALARRVRLEGVPEDYPPERQDLYGFTVGDAISSKDCTRRTREK